MRTAEEGAIHLAFWAGEGGKQAELILIQTLPLGKLAVAGKQLLPPTVAGPAMTLDLDLASSTIHPSRRGICQGLQSRAKDPSPGFPDSGPPLVTGQLFQE